MYRQMQGLIAPLVFPGDSAPDVVDSVLQLLALAFFSLSLSNACTTVLPVHRSGSSLDIFAHFEGSVTQIHSDPCFLCMKGRRLHRLIPGSESEPRLGSGIRVAKL